jgi:TRAP-type C4-dicarboxylate transport system substrate-binding protein
MNRRMMVKSLGAALATPFLLTRSACAAEITLRLNHALPATEELHSAFLINWAAGIRDASGGRLEVQLLPATQQVGAPRQLVGRVRDGAADLAWIAGADAGGQFPRLEVLHLPFVAARSGLVNSQVAQEFADKHPEEFAGLQPLIAVASDHGVIHANRQITTLAELKGARLRPPTPLAGEALQALGAIAVTVEDRLLPQAFAQQVLDGGVAPWGGAAASLSEVGFHSEFAATPTLCASTFLLLMNKARFDGVPEDLRRVLLERSGMAAARLAGEAFDASSTKVGAAAQARGAIVVIAEDEKRRWAEAVRPVVTAWVERSRALGIDGNALLAEVSALLAKYEPPVVAAPPPQPVAPAGQPPQAVAPASQPPALQPGVFTPGAVPPVPSAQPLAAPATPAPGALAPPPAQPAAVP